MHQFIGLAFSLISFGLVCTTYNSLKPSETKSWLHGETFLSILISNLTGFFLLAVTILARDFWLFATGGNDQANYLYLAVDLVSVGLIAASLFGFRAALKVTSGQATASGTVSSFPTRPVSPGTPAPSDRKAA